MALIKTTKFEKILAILVSIIIILLVSRAYYTKYIPIKNNNKWTVGVVFDKYKVSQSSRYIQYKFCVDDSIYSASDNVILYDHVKVDSVQYIVAYNPEKPSLSKMLIELPSVKADWCGDLDTLKSVLDYEFSFWDF